MTESQWHSNKYAVLDALTRQILPNIGNTERIWFCIQMWDDKQGVAKLVNQTIGLNINQALPKNPPAWD